VCWGVGSRGDVSAKAVGVFMIDTAGKLELVDKFCCLGDMLGNVGRAEEASTTRVKGVDKFKFLDKFNDLVQYQF